MVVQEDNHELISTFGENFRNCWNMSQSMSHMLLFARSMVVEQWIPNSFGCSNIALWTKYGIAKYWANTEMEPLLFTSFIYFDNVGESYDLCSKVGFWENKLKLSCHELLCENTNDNLIAHVEEMTEKQTSIFDWINYCQYCLKNNTLRSFQQKLGPNTGCFPKDNTVNEMINRFPNSLSFCGSYDFGIPLIINTSDLVPNILKEFSFSYICYCRENLFTFKCDNNFTQFVTSQVLSFGEFGIHVVSLLVTFFSTFLPKLKSVVTQRKFFRIFTIAMVLLSEFFLSFSFVISAAWGSNLVTTILGNTALSLVFFNLFSWIAYWFRLVLFVKTRKTKPTIAVYVGLALLWLIVGALVPCLVAVLGQQQILQVVQFYAYYIIALSFVACIIFIISSIWIYWAMKKVSDVNMLNTSFIRFVAFSSLSSFIFSIAYVIITQVQGGLLIGVLSGSFSITTHVSIASITLGLTYMEFEKEEFTDFYVSCCSNLFGKSLQSTTRSASSSSHTNVEDYSTIYEDPSGVENSTYYSKMPVNSEKD
ncbi:hypothetical protein FDP41_003040 [Naegleria fowleri]|uniref:Uncharacterized protein n=1 Tax=Naegleria fowleri TaxID=5763 RepID=A0A6A5BUW3_NAEFO|nr:uncharacterized protein FDP41_003040 [Naegleria fowleri]KAF0977718.1 hypothetical protein FDP41_003040 [Naegleria fowleri]